MTMGETSSVPYLSIVATSRNDDHGGGMTRRMQIFVDALAAQAAKHRLSCELVLVEWNPPVDRPPLAEALRWPEHGGFCPVRIVTVPPEVHARFPHHEHLALFQMIAKNVGIRRARGTFVLATNVDIIFSDPLMAFLARRELDPGRTYRSTRIDVDREVPLAEVDHQLEYCRSHVLRANFAEGLMLTPADGRPHGAAEATVLAGDWTRFGHRLAHSPFGRAVSDTRLAPPFRAAMRLTRASVRALRRLQIVAVDSPSGAPGADIRDVVDEFLVEYRPCPELFCANCGDFTLLAKDAWSVIQGNPELEMFSFHLDSLALHIAHAAGYRELRLGPELVHYHIEHGRGWGGYMDHRRLYESFRSRGVPVMTWGEMVRHAAELTRGASPQFSGPNWGLAELDLPETRVA